MSTMVADHFYRIVLAIIATAVLACVFTIYTAMADQPRRAAISTPQIMLTDMAID